ncbi:NAD-P-binding protein [Rhodofomes roseus]|uniref:NAD-P-binding protein n=1 Tax=Rhodofomes roseus TaxID=34475 RepID=A0ABQ8JXU5_9APHY|nr:NAD-P-binding protein [Rhodofomes roseus]KAH9829046.1 NAD-P-binding protein [Rhodofomes roseus]
MSKSELILVTGASGFIGSHVVVQLLEAGYRVRGTARGAKTDVLRSAFTNPNFESTAIDDITTSDFTSALQGVDAVIHVASPLAGRESPEVTLNSAVEGTLNILRQAVKAGVSNVVLTSSWATTIDPGSSSFTGVTFTEKDWGKITKEQLFNPELNALAVYCGTKILAEHAAWEFARANSELDLATINPPFVYGRPVPGVASGSGINSLGTNGLLYQLIAGEPGRPLPPQIPPFYCHVQDVARAHVLALRLPKLPSGSDVEEKRFLVAGPATMLYADAVKTLLEERPALKNRFPTRENAPPLPGPLSTVDTTRAKEVLGMREYRGAKDTLLETIDVLLEVEKTWQ